MYRIESLQHTSAPSYITTYDLKHGQPFHGCAFPDKRASNLSNKTGNSVHKAEKSPTTVVSLFVLPCRRRKRGPLEFASVPVSDLKGILMFPLNWKTNWEFIAGIKPNCVNDKSKADGFQIHILRYAA